MLTRRGCGWWVPPSADGIAEGLRAATALDTRVLRDMGDKGRDVVASDFAWPQVAQAFASLYDDLRTGNAR
jgi:glycosyltransferase involved in cell wall biosynthesis